MASNSNSKDSVCKIFVESFPKLSVANIYILSGDLTPDASISAHGSRIHIPSLNIGTTVFGLSFESVKCKPLQAFRPPDVAHFRLITQPQNAFKGSGRAEVLSRNFQNQAQDAGITNLLKNSLNDVAIIEHNPYYLKCRMCSSTLSDVGGRPGRESIVFTKIRSLPGNNWEEYANDLWYCHAPNPQGTCDTRPADSATVESNITDGFAQMSIAPYSQMGSKCHVDSHNPSVSPSPPKNAFTSLQSPSTNTCYYGPCYWAVNPVIFPRIVYQLKNSTDFGSSTSPDSDAKTNGSMMLNCPAVCSICRSEVGVFSTQHCLLLWDFGVEWMAKSPEELGRESPESGLDSKENPVIAASIKKRAVENFKKIIFAALHEWSFSLTCKLMIKSTSRGQALFLWNIDRNLTIYEGTLQDNNNSNTINPQKAAKFMFCPVKDGELDNKNPFDEQVYKSGGSDHQVFIPRTILENGLHTLAEISSMYLTPPESLKCGFLCYSCT